MNTTCQFCNKTFSIQRTLYQHYNRCKNKNIYEQEQKYEAQIQTLRTQLQIQKEEYKNQLQKRQEEYKNQLQNRQEEYENQLQTQLQTQKEQYEIQIQNLREQLDEFKTQIFEIAKQPKEQNTINNNTTKTITHNEKINILNQLAPMDFEQSEEEIEKIIKTHFTEEVFLGGPRAIAQMIVRHILQDPESNKFRLLCTDSSRKHFKYVNAKTGEVQIDYRFQKFYDLLKTPSQRANFLACFLTLEKNDYKNDKYFSDVRDRNSNFIKSRDLLSDRIISEITKT